MADMVQTTSQQEAADNLFRALDIITSKRLSSLAFDSTQVCVIESIENEKNGEYKVTDGASTYIAYGDAGYLKGQKVMVRIPNNDMEGQKTITGLYRSKNNEQVVYVSALDNFIDVTNNLMEDNISSSLKANHALERTIVLWELTDISYKGYDRLGIGGKFKTLLDSKTVQGTYGLRLDVLSKTESGLSENYSYYLDSSDMYGNPYIYSTFFKQEQIYDIAGLHEIIGMRLCFYQNNDFILNSGKELDRIYTITEISNGKYFSGERELIAQNAETYDVGAQVLTRFEDNEIKILGLFNQQYDIFLEAPYLALGYDINTFTGDTVLLGTHDSLTYGRNTAPSERTVYMRWVHKNEQDNYSSIDTKEEMPSGNQAIIHWYRYLPQRDVHDVLAGNFWKEFNPGMDLFNYTFEPNYDISEDGIKVIVEFPSRTSINNNLQDNRELDSLIDNLKKVMTADGFSMILINNMTSEIENLKSVEDLEELNKTAGDLLRTLNKENTIGAFEEIYNFILDLRSSTKYYYSDPLYFTNEVSPAEEILDMVQGLSIVVDAENYDGIYNLYDSTNEIINRVEASKTRKMFVNFISETTGEEKLQAADSITWYFPTANTMIQAPAEGYEYFSENGDEYITDCGRPGYVAIKRVGTDSLDELPEDVQLIDINQNFRIKDYYVQTATNNTIYCEVVRRKGTVYSAAKQIFFGTSGSNGTDATFILRLYSVDENNKPVNEIPGITHGGKAIVVPELYDYNNKALEISGVRYSWESRSGKDADKDAYAIVGQGLEGKYLLTSNGDISMYLYQHYVLKATIDWKVEKEYNEDGSIKSDERNIELSAYLPIAVKKDDTYTSFEGTTRIVYDSQGGNPVYYKNPYNLYNNSYTTDNSVEWLGLSNDFIDDILSVKYYPTIGSDNSLTPRNMFYQDLEPYSVIGLKGTDLSLENLTTLWNNYAVAKRQADNAQGIAEAKTAFQTEVKNLVNDYGVWIQPIIILQNVYGSAMLNGWNGNLTIDEKNGTILSTAVGAGKKNSDNTFSGVLMGDVTTEELDRHSGIGLYGFDHGEQSYGFNINGTAFIGKAGKGRINFDGANGTITSGNYKKPTNDEQGSGMKIDLDDSYMDIFGEAGQILLNTKDSSKPLFTIISGDSNALMLVSRETYYLQTNNYSTETKEGTKFDLWNSTLSLYGQAGQVLFNTKTSNSNNPLLRINGFVGSGEEKTAKTLMEVGTNYYLQTLDYDPEAEEPKGTHIDLKNSKLNFYGQGGSVLIDTSRSNDSNLFTIVGKEQETLMEIGNKNYYIQTSNYSEEEGKEAGVKFDLQNSLMNIYGNAGAIKINTEEDEDENGNPLPLFAILDDDSNVLMNIGEDEYFIQTSNYSEEEGNEAGVKFDLSNSTLNFFGSGGSLKINTNATSGNALFQIDSESDNTLINIGNDQYFIRSNNYLESENVQVRGLNFDINAGRLYMVKTNSPTGNNAGDKIGTVLISSASGDPYFKITSMYDEVEQTLMHISSSSMYLRSNNYTEQNGSIRVGTIFNLNAGKLFSAKPVYKEDGSFETEADGTTIKRAGTVTISTVNGDPYFRVTTTAGGTEKSLIYISDSSMFLQTANYQAPSGEQLGQGTRINLNPSGSSSIISYDFMINASNSEGGYIKINSSDSEEYPLQIGEGFKVDWNGNLIAQGAITATAGTLGGWYIDEKGIYDYDPKTAGTRTGMALLSDGDSSDKKLRIAVGTFNITETEGTTEGEEGEEEDYIIQSSTDKGFFIYKDGTLKSTGATLISSTISSAKINDATISRGSISRATISSATIKGNCTVNGTLNGGTISGGTISGGTINVEGLITCGGLQVGTQEYKPRTVGARFVLSANTTSKHACTTETSTVTVSDTTYTSTRTGGASPGGTCSITIDGKTYTGSISVNSHTHSYDKADKTHTASISDSGSFHLYPNTILASNPIIAAYNISAED